MELGGRILWAFLSGPGRRRGTRGWPFSSWQPHLPLAGSLNATELVSHWTAIFEKRGIPEAQASSEYIVAHVLGAKTVKCSVVKRGEGWGGRTLGNSSQAYLPHREC